MKSGSFSLFIILITLLSAFLNFNQCSTSSDPPDYNNKRNFGYLKGFIKDSDTGLPKNSINSIIIIQFQEVYDVRKV